MPVYDRPGRLEAERRRNRIADARLAGKRQNEIAEAEGVSQPTVSRHLKAIKAEWRKEAAATYGEHVARELATISAMDRTAAEQIDTLLTAGVRKLPKGGLTLDGELIGLAREWMAERRHLRGRVAALLGLDAPRRQEVSGPAQGGAPIEVVWRTLPDDSESKAEAARLLWESGALGYDETEEDPDE